MEPVIITAALVGAEVTSEQTPYLPVTGDEIGAGAAQAVAAGAAVIHLHVRTAEGKPSQDAGLFAAAVRSIRDRTDAVVQVSTGGAVSMTAEERLPPVVGLPPELCPDMASLNTGSVNFGDEVFLNLPPMIEDFARAMRKRGITPEVEVYEPGMIDTALQLVERGLLEKPLRSISFSGCREQPRLLPDSSSTLWKAC